MNKIVTAEFGRPQISTLNGISVVLCCHNSALRIVETLRHLQAQKAMSGVAWEVVLVDNASEDATVDIARSAWAEFPTAPLRVVHEPRLGLSHARIKGIQSARYDLVSLVDDDNWLEPDWLSKVMNIMSEHPTVGACGGRNDGEFEAPPPSWFQDYDECYAVGRQWRESGDITWSRGHLWGAGLTLRKAAWDTLIRGGFSPLLSDRSGSVLTSGGDYEICYALRLAGWKLWYCDGLVLRHWIPESRLSFDYLCRLWRGFGEQTTGHDPYRMYVNFLPSEVKSLFGKVWIRQLLREFYNAVIRNWKSWFRPPWRQPPIQMRLNSLFRRGRIAALWSLGGQYDINITELKDKKWIVIDRSAAIALSRNPRVADRPLVSVKQFPLVTALICNYNYSRFLAPAVDSALAQTWKNLEVLIVDDGSTDCSREVLEGYGDKIRVVLKENGGQASAFNRGIQEARGEIICFLDSDDLWHQTKVERVVEKYREGSWGLVCHDLELMDSGGALLGEESWCEFESVRLASGDVFESITESGYPWVFSPTSGMSLPTRIARKIFPLPEHEWRICADTPLAYAAICHAPVGVLPGKWGRYRLHGQNGFGPVNNDPVWARIVGIVHPARCYLFLRDYVKTIGRELKVSPTDNYEYRRRFRMIASDQPWKLLPELWSQNINSAPKNLWNLRFLVLDPLLAAAIALRLPVAHREIRKRFREYSAKVEPRALAYLRGEDEAGTR